MVGVVTAIFKQIKGIQKTDAVLLGDHSASQTFVISGATWLTHFNVIIQVWQPAAYMTYKWFSILKANYFKDKYSIKTV